MDFECEGQSAACLRQWQTRPLKVVFRECAAGDIHERVQQRVECIAVAATFVCTKRGFLFERSSQLVVEEFTNVALHIVLCRVCEAMASEWTTTKWFNILTAKAGACLSNQFHTQEECHRRTSSESILRTKFAADCPPDCSVDNH